MMRHHYRILDVGLCVESDSEEFIGAFDRDYSWFSVATENGGAGVSFCVSFASCPTGPVLHIGGNEFPLAGHPAPASHARQVVAQSVMAQVRGYIVLHAGVVCAGTDALAVCGPPGAGKTTLVMKLLESGLRLLSDDFCPIHLESGLVYPFPRTLWVRPAPEGIPGGGERPAPPGIHAGKSAVKPGGEGIAIARGPCRLRSLICLQADGEAAQWRDLVVKLKDGRQEEFISSLETVGGVICESMKAGSGNWAIRYPRKQGLGGRVREVLRRRRDCVWNVFRVNGACPDFQAVPTLTPIPAHEAAFFALSELKQDMGETGGGFFRGGKPGGGFMRLVGLLGDTACFRLTAGRLDMLGELALETLGFRNSRFTATQ